MRAGLALVGEAGPELLSLGRGARVTPLTPSSFGAGARGEVTVIINLNGVDLTEGSSRVLEQIREGLRQLDLESA